MGVFLLNLNQVELGNILRSLRNFSGFTQVELSQVTGIHVDTIRRIENGFVIPKHETIVLLSHALKINIGEIYTLTYKNDSLIHRLELITETILENHKENFEKEVYKLESIIKSNRTSYALYSNRDIKKIKAYIITARDFLLGNKRGLNKSVEVLEDALFKELKNNKANAKIDSDDLIKKLKFTYLDLMLLVLYGGVLGDLKRICESTTVLEFCQKRSKILKLQSIPYAKLQLKLIYNLAYNYHIYDYHRKVVRISEEGISLAQKYHLMYHLPQIYYRKGIAEYYLKDKSYTESLKKTLTLFDIYENFQLKSKYIEITEDVHGIKMGDL